jgi:hypothetical protein
MGEEEVVAGSEEQFTPVVGAVLAPPIATAATDGRVHLAYELLLQNALSQDVDLDAVTVKGDGVDLLTLEADDLLGWSKVFGENEPTTTIGPGQQALVWLDVVVETMADVPARLEHSIRISPSEPIPPVVASTMTETIAAVTPDTREPVVIGAPLAGAGWLDGNSCCAVTAHRAAVNPINGALHVPERFAIDFVRLDGGGRIFDGPIDELDSYAYYGADIHAVADGPIVAMRWDLEEQVPGANPTGLSVDEYGGNHIVQDIGDGRYAFYAHLQEGNPLEVEIGQQLSRGAVIARLGNTGNTDSPHLHFHVMDSPLPLASNGLPFLIESFDLVGAVASADDVDACVSEPVACAIDESGAGARRNESPLFRDVMDFPAQP